MMNQPLLLAVARSRPPAARLFNTSRSDLLDALPPCRVKSKKCEAHSKRL
jgi:hypothetical protein